MVTAPRTPSQRSEIREPYVIGVDFSSLSGRALLGRLSDGLGISTSTLTVTVSP